MGLLRVLEWIFCIYCATHIPITILLDSQQLFPRWLYPQALINTNRQYEHDFKDALTANAPEWLMPFFWDEMLFQLPFFFVGTYAFYKGSCQWIRTPSLIYATHVATTLQPCLAYNLFHDFSDAPPEAPGPATMEERLKLIAVYIPYFIIPIVMFFTMIFSKAYNGNEQVSSDLGKQKTR